MIQNIEGCNWKDNQIMRMIKNKKKFTIDRMNTKFER